MFVFSLRVPTIYVQNTNYLNYSLYHSLLATTVYQLNIKIRRINQNNNFRIFKIFRKNAMQRIQGKSHLNKK